MDLELVWLQCLANGRLEGPTLLCCNDDDSAHAEH